jgi:hypothetical protein
MADIQIQGECNRYSRILTGFVEKFGPGIEGPEACFWMDYLNLL